MRRQRSSDIVRDTLTIVTDDGARLRCSVSSVGRSEQPRWMIMDQDGNQYIGPVVSGERSGNTDEQQLIAWWKDHPTRVADRAD